MGKGGFCGALGGVWGRREGLEGFGGISSVGIVAPGKCSRGETWVWDLCGWGNVGLIGSVGRVSTSYDVRKACEGLRGCGTYYVQGALIGNGKSCMQECLVVEGNHPTGTYLTIVATEECYVA